MVVKETNPGPDVTTDEQVASEYHAPLYKSDMLTLRPAWLKKYMSTTYRTFV
jgi:hypothetical protein